MARRELEVTQGKQAASKFLEGTKRKFGNELRSTSNSVSEHCLMECEWIFGALALSGTGSSMMAIELGASSTLRGHGAVDIGASAGNLRPDLHSEQTTYLPYRSVPYCSDAVLNPE